MPKKKETGETSTRINEDTYAMIQAHLGHAIIINNVAELLPGSKVNVEALEAAYELLGFDVYVCNDYSQEGLERIMTWMTIKETHQYSSAFSLTVIGGGNADGDLLDCEDESFISITELTDRLMEVETLRNKPKLVHIHMCVEDDEVNGSLIDDLDIEAGKDMFLVCSSSYETSGDNENGREQEACSEYLLMYAEHLKQNYTTHSVGEIVTLVKTKLKQKNSLTDDVLMDVARCVPGQAIEAMAVGALELDEATIRNTRHNRKGEAEMFSFEILYHWRNKSQENNTKERLAELFREESRNYGSVNWDDVNSILVTHTKEVPQSYKESNGLKKVLRFDNFHVPKDTKMKQLQKMNEKLLSDVGKGAKSKYDDQLRKKLRREKDELQRQKEEMEKREEELQESRDRMAKKLEEEKKKTKRLQETGNKEANKEEKQNKEGLKSEQTDLKSMVRKRKVEKQETTPLQEVEEDMTSSKQMEEDMTSLHQSVLGEMNESNSQQREGETSVQDQCPF